MAFCRWKIVCLMVCGQVIRLQCKGLSGSWGLEEELGRDIWGRSESCRPFCSLRADSTHRSPSCPPTQSWITSTKLGEPGSRTLPPGPVALQALLSKPLSPAPGSITEFHLRNQKERKRKKWVNETKREGPRKCCEQQHGRPFLEESSFCFLWLKVTED